jgi:hypothetical protein
MYNGQTKNTIQKDLATQTPLKTGMKSGAEEK